MAPPRTKAQAAALLQSVDEVEAQFYEALQQGDLERLMALWSDDDDVVCVHPGGPRMVGHAAVRASFEAIFANGNIPVRPDKTHAVEGQGSAVHSVVEHVELNTPQGTQSATVIATNVYLKTAQGWRMVVHHASAAAPREASEIGTVPSILH